MENSGLEILFIIVIGAMLCRETSKTGKRIGLLIGSSYILLSVVLIWRGRGAADGTDFMQKLKTFVLFAILAVIALEDLKSYRILNKYLLTALILRFILYIGELFCSNEQFLTIVLGDIIALLIMLVFVAVITAVTKEGMGWGDKKLLLTMTLYLGIERIYGAVFFSFCISFIVGIILLATRKKTGKDAIPMAPFLLAGTYIGLYLGG